MLIQEFSFGNFRSFKEIQTLNMASARIKSKHEFLDENNLIKNYDGKGISFLKSKAVYGANASGKSNIVKAFIVFLRIVGQSVKDEKVLQLVEAFKLSTETEDEPTFFQLIFWIENTRYRYGFETDDKRISAEWLYAKPGERELPYFIRDHQEIVEIDKTNFSEGNKFVRLFDGESSDNELFRANSLFLSTISSLGFGKLSKQLTEAFASVLIINGLGNRDLFYHAGNQLLDKVKRKYIIDFLKYGDTGIESMDALEIPSDSIPDGAAKSENGSDDKRKKLIVSARKKFDKDLEIKSIEPFLFEMMESEGTLKLFELSPIIFEALNENRPLIIDEFDARFHPLLTKKIVELFNSKRNKGAQLIFVTHDTNLLSADFLRRDQIEFVEKDKYGASHLYCLTQFKGVRNTASFEKDYISGKYGAIPFLGDFNKLLNFDDNA